MEKEIEDLKTRVDFLEKRIVDLDLLISKRLEMLEKSQNEFVLKKDLDKEVTKAAKSAQKFK